MTNPTDNDKDILRIALVGQAVQQADIRVLNPSVIEGMKPLLDADVAFIDLETTIAEEGDPIEQLDPKMGHVAMPPEALDSLSAMGLNLFATSNNHSYDLGRIGMENVNRNLDARGLAHAGIGANAAAAVAPTYMETPKGRVSLISVASGLLVPESVATETGIGVFEIPLEGGIPDVDAGRPAKAATSRILASIREAAANSDFVISYHHNHVYDKSFVPMMRQMMPERLVPPPWVRDWAHEQVDAGADMVAMHGVPIFQGIEIYDGKPIFYGLGNFIFQMPLCIADFEPFAYEGVVVQVDIQDRRLRSIACRAIEIDPAGCSDSGDFSVLTRGLPRPMSGDRAVSVLQRMVDLSKDLGTDMRIDGETARFDVPIAQTVAGGALHAAR